MRTRSTLLSLVAAAAVGSAVAPASAEPLCLRDVDCVDVVVDDNAVAVASGGTCAPVLCLPGVSLAAGTFSPPGYTANVTCTHDTQGTLTTTATAGPRNGSAVTAIRATCTAVDPLGTVGSSEAYGPGPVVSAQRSFQRARGPVRFCTVLTVDWADGSFETTASGGPGCEHDEG